MAGPLQACDCVLLEVDDPDAADSPAERAHRERRLRFYLRNGLLETGVRVTAFGVGLRVLALPVGELPEPGQVRRDYEMLYRAMLPKRLYETKVSIL